MHFLYTLGLILFRFILIIISPFNTKAKLWIKGRQNILNRISDSLADDEKRIWIHAASLGEFEQGRPIIEKLKQDYPGYKLFLTFFSPSGYEIRKNYEFADYIFYLPNDTSTKAKKFIELVKPQFVLFIKYEYWYNYLMTLKKKNIPTYMVSSIFRKNQIFFKWYGKWYKQMLMSVTHFFVQNQESKELLQKLKYNNVSVTGDTRFDRVFEVYKQATPFPVIEKFKNKRNIIIAGSTWKPDEEILTNYINTKDNSWKYIIAPHEIHERNIKRIEYSLHKKTIRYSQADEKTITEYDVLIIDNVGMLSSLYRYGNIAYIGGGFSTGIHNILEAATFGIPVIFGPDYKNFQEAQSLLKLGGAFSINNQKDFNDITNSLITNKLIKEKGGICKTYINKNKGATFKIIDHIFKQSGLQT
ncbi:MAG: hypothetical protein B6I20_05780 [Bacteroidetes bacterium 4572_117]|nr:MAG: hypothetical protein B6I20_05780 [Bacteroidetes bacterium 4572_117]